MAVRRKTGEVYFTDPNRAGGFFRNESGVSSVYRVTAAGRVDLLIQDLSFPNGIAFSPDESKLYVANTQPEKTWWVYDVGSDGSARNGRILLDAAKIPGTNGPDSMKVDKAGNLYAAGPGGILIISPQGRHLGTIQFAEPATNCAWGDADGKTLYITARPGLYRIRLNVGGKIP